MEDPNERVRFSTSYNKYEDLVTSILNADKQKISGSELRCCCPFHDDENPSFSINLETGAYYCQTCEEKGSITKFVAKIKNIDNKQAWKEICEYTGEDYTKTISYPYTLEDFAKEKKFNIDYIKQMQIKTSEDKTNCIEIPYFDTDGKYIRKKYRNNPNNPIRFYWDNSNTEVPLYGLWLLNSYTNDYIVITEGETDCITLWHYGIHAIGVPGAKAFKAGYAKYFDKFEKIYIHSDEDEAAVNFVSSIQAVLPSEKLYKINSKALGCKDINELHINDKLNIDELFKTAVKLDELVTFEEPVEEHVVVGDQLIETYNLKYYNGLVYYYNNGVYKCATDNFLYSCIVKNINKSAKKSFYKNVINYINGLLYNDQEIIPDINYINYKNGLYNLVDNKLYKHTPDIFTVNQLNCNYNADIIPCTIVDKFLDDITCHNIKRKQAILIIIGYCQTTRINLQKSFIFYGSKGANGKSTLANLIMALIGKENICSITLQTFAQRFGTSEINGKILNAS